MRTASSSVKRIGFRSLNWKTIHAHQPVQEDIDTLKKLGCEVTAHAHGDHQDIRYRCVQWQTIEVPTDSLKISWAQWLLKKDMEIVVVDPPANTPNPTVQYRLTEPKTLHLHDADKADQIVGTLQMIGVEVATHSHGDHLDARFHCPQWKTIELANEAQAHSWEKWLQEAGFETHHTHVR